MMCRMNNRRPSVMILANGGRHVGWGHIMRCLSIARAVEEQGGKALFAVMNAESASLVSTFGFDCRILDLASILGKDEAELVRSVALENGIQSILVDTYSVTDSFFNKLHDDFFKVGYIDDLYIEGVGGLEAPEAFDVDLVVNYGFMFADADYETVYSKKPTRCLVGPSFAPVRCAFIGLVSPVQPEVGRILVTSGSTNPNRAIERMLFACEWVNPDIEIHVVLGKNAIVDFSEIDQKRFVFHKGVNDLSELMVLSDIAISSAGSTLYELACVGVPTIALPVVENQILNAKGFERRGLGFAYQSLDWTHNELGEMIVSLLKDYAMRKECSELMRSTVDGEGSERIAQTLLCLAFARTGLRRGITNL